MTKKTAVKVKEPNTLERLDTSDLKSQQWVKRLMKMVVSNSQHPNSVYKKTKEILLRRADLQKEDTDYLIETFGYIDDYQETHGLLCLTDTDKKKWFAMTDFTNALIAEYKCTTPSEMTLCEMVACNYFEKLRLTNRLSSTMNAAEYITHERNSYITALGKSIERADRGYITALNTLRDIRSPMPNIHIKTNTAIVGTNQQFNSNAPYNEIIEG